MDSTLTYPIHHRRLDNGLRIYVSPDPWTPVVGVNLWYHVGSSDEVRGRTGFAHLFEHLMFQGSANVASGEHLAALQAVGGSVNGTTSFDRTNYFESVPAGATELALWLESDRLASLLSAVDQASLDTQREVVKEEKRQRYDNVPYGQTMPTLLRLVFGDHHHYGHSPIGSMTDLDAATLTDVHAFFTQHYRPDNAVLALSGAITPADAFTLADTYFGSIPSLADPVARRTDALPPLSGVPRHETVKAVPREAIYCAWRLPDATDPAHEAIALGLSVLGDSLTSRLYQGLVRGMVADGSGAHAMDLVRGNSFAIAHATTRATVTTDDLEAAMMDIWQEFCDTGPTEQETLRAQARFTREWFTDLARLDQRADLINESVTLFGDPHRINTRLTSVTAITPDDIASACRAWLRPDQRAVLTYRKAGS